MLRQPRQEPVHAPRQERIFGNGIVFLFLSLLFIFTLADLFTRRLDNEMHITKSPVDKEWVHPSTLQGGH